MHISWLRKKLAVEGGAIDERIATVRGVGFRFDTDRFDTDRSHTDRTDDGRTDGGPRLDAD